MTVPPPQPPVPPVPPGQSMPPAPPSQPAVGTIRLTIQGSIWTANAITPRVRINGYPVPSRYGVQDLPVYAGPNHLDIDTQWMRTYGQAGIDTSVAPGQVVEVWYASPVHQFARGNIGFTKQPRPGTGCLWVGLAAVALFCVLALLADVLAG
ncbi:hypothetical protein [Phycicoccus sp. Soil803]|uniref:hypothetical protein n=1 Tax=Phycicoccus sp. Soil803 TaxID=1736415 RepID=UPI00138ECAE8|nr:hypothetical protein [Phycicoccus sp. Soil803]